MNISKFTQIIKHSLLIFHFSLFILLAPSVSAQSWKLYKKNDALDCRFFATDNLHNIYIITPKSEILKYNEDGSFEARFASLKMGKMGHFDAMNPFKLLVYYPDFQTIQLLDRELNSLGSFNLLDRGVARVGAVAMSDDGKIWIYDAGTNKIMTISGTEKAQQVQGGIVPFAGSTPNQMIFRSNNLYVNVPEKGIYMFDRFGKYLKLLNIKNASYFQVFGNELLYNQLGKMYIFNLQTLKSAEMKMPEGVKGSEPLRLEKNWLFVQQGRTIVIYEDK
jgi:hypothetical protein